MVEPQTSSLPPESAGRLIAFARACKGAARAIALYPPEHPAIGDAMRRLAAAATLATSSGPLSLLVLPDNLLVGGRTTAKPDAAVVELAGLLHTHLVGELTVQRDVDPAAWRTLLGLLGRDPVDVRARGGIARALTTAGGIGLEINELDYAELIKDRAEGELASWDVIIQNCLQKDAVDLDEKALRLLAEIASQPDRLAEFYARTEEQPGKATVREKSVALLRALRGISSFFGREEPDRLNEIFTNMASAFSHLTPDFVMELLDVGSEPGSENTALVREITSRITDVTIGQFVAKSVERDRACTSRLTDAFRALLPDASHRQPALQAAREALSKTPVGQDAGFERLWSQVENVLTSYTDKDWVSDSYNQELSTARAHAGEMDHIADDPPERIIGWLTTVSDVAVRALDLQLLADLLLVERDAAKREELLKLVVSQVDELVVLGDFDSARRLVEGLVAVGGPDGPVDAKPQVAKAVEQIVAGQFMTQVTVHLNGVRDEEFEQVKALCTAVGPGLVPRLAESLSSETRVRARQRLTDLLIGFGEHGRHSVSQLRQSPLAIVRKTAVQLLRSFGGPESLPDLEALIDDTEPSVQREAARALIGLGFSESFELLQKVLLAPKHKGRPAVLEELTATRDQKAKPLFCYLVRHIECRGQLREVYLRSVGRLGMLGGLDAVEALTEVLKKGQWWAPMRTREVRTFAAEALAHITLPEAQDALRDAAENGSFGVRAVARRYVKG